MRQDSRNPHIQERHGPHEPESAVDGVAENLPRRLATVRLWSMAARGPRGNRACASVAARNPSTLASTYARLSLLSVLRMLRFRPKVVGWKDEVILLAHSLL